MNDIQLVEAENMKTIEHYGCSLVFGLLNLGTLHKFQMVAIKQGFLTTDEEELCKTMLWEITRLRNLYESQLKNILERTEMTQEMIVKYLQSLFPKAKKMRSKTPKKEK